MNITNHKNNIITIQKFWDTELCDAIINEVNLRGNLPKEPIENEIDLIGSRNNYRVIINSKEIADGIWLYFKSIKSLNSKFSSAIGINESLRIYKYFPTQEFKKHRDSSFKRNEKEKSFFSLLIYLNDNYGGGFTVFDNIEIQPETGTAVIFPHELLHSGTKVTTGIKYILRTDIIFKLQ